MDFTAGDNIMKSSHGLERRNIGVGTEIVKKPCMSIITRWQSSFRNPNRQNMPQLIVSPPLTDESATNQYSPPPNSSNSCPPNHRYVSYSILSYSHNDERFPIPPQICLEVVHRFHLEDRRN